MAGDWIKMRKDLRDEPEVFTMAASLKLDRDSVVGKLHRFWSWVDGHMEREDSVIDGVSVDVIVECHGFSTALQNVGWLELSTSGIRVPNFERHLSQNAKRRALHAEEMRQWRGTSREDSVSGKGSPEKRREEKIHHPTRALKDFEPKKSRKRVVIPADFPPPEALKSYPLFAADKRLCYFWEAKLADWREHYPGIDINLELFASHDWQTADPARRKSNQIAFLANWFKKAQTEAWAKSGRAGKPKTEKEYIRDIFAQQPEQMDTLGENNVLH